MLVQMYTLGGKELIKVAFFNYKQITLVFKENNDNEHNPSFRNNVSEINA